MARIARVVAVDMPHHIVQRGNRRQNVFFNEKDKQTYMNILKEESTSHDLEIWAYCLMDNHIHLIAVPRKEDSLAKAIGTTHKKYTRMINFREGWRGYLWQGRFSSFPLDERHLYAAMRYVERNPVRAKIVNNAEDYPWSSAKTHIDQTEDSLVKHCYLENEIKDWREFLSPEEEQGDLKLFRRHGATGRPLGSSDFIEHLARKLGVDLRKKRPGPKVTIKSSN